MTRIFAALVAMYTLGAALTACSSDSNDSKVNVFAAASLTEAFNDSAAELRALDPKVEPAFNFAGSSALVQQIIDGAPADVFASADEANMQMLVDAKMVEAPHVFAHNVLQIAVAPGNPRNIKTLADLERSGVNLVLADPAVPAGNYAQQAFSEAGLPAPRPKSQELDVNAALAKLTSGEADAVIVYRTDVEEAGAAVEAVPIPDPDNVVATYPIAVVSGAEHRKAAEHFVEEAVSGAVQQTLRARGFLAP